MKLFKFPRRSRTVQASSEHSARTVWFSDGSGQAAECLGGTDQISVLLLKLDISCQHGTGRVLTGCWHTSCCPVVMLHWSMTVNAAALSTAELYSNR